MAMSMSMAIYVKNEDYNLKMYGNQSDQHLHNVIYLRPTNTVGSLIREIQTVYSISDKGMKRRIVFHPSSKKELTGEVESTTTTLEQCGIKEYDSLELGFRESFVVEVTMSKGISKKMRVSPFETYREVKRRAKEMSKGPLDDRTLISTGVFRKTYSNPGIGINIGDDAQSKFGFFVAIAGSSINFSIVCKPNDKVRDTRERIRKMADDPSNKELYRLSLIKEGLFVLRDKSDVLDDDATIGLCRCLTVLPSSPLTISVFIPKTGQCFDLDKVKCYWTTLMLKERINELTGISPRNQCLTIGKYRLSNYISLWRHVIKDPFGVQSEGIKQRFVIQLDTVEDSNNETPKPEDTRRLERQSRRLGNDDEQFQVSIEIPTIPVCFPLKLVPSDTIGEMRKDIQRNIKEGLFVLFFHGKQLEDDSITLNQCGIKNMDTVQVLEKGSFEICINVLEDNAGQQRVRVESFETVGKLKEKLQMLTGIPRRKQCLLYCDWFLDDDERFLGDHGIATGSVIPRIQDDESFPGDLAISAGLAISRVLLNGEFLCDHKKEFSVFLYAFEDAREAKAGLCTLDARKINLYSHFPSNLLNSPIKSVSTTVLQIAIEIPSMRWRFPLICNPNETIAGVRHAIRENSYVEHKELFGQRYIEEGRFVLAFNRNRLLDEAMTLEDCGIKHTDSIQLLDDSSFPIYLHVFERALYTRLDVKCFDTIRELREVIFSMSGIPPSKQHMYCSETGWWLEDDEEGRRRLVDYDITRGVPHEKSVKKFSRSRHFRERRNDIMSLYAGSSRHYADIKKHISWQ